MPDLGFNTYHSSRFMGFYLVDPDEGTILGQFPHLFPIWIAVDYGAYGLTGARYVVSALAILGIVAVYFCGCWLVGRPAAAAGALLLTVNVVTVWYSRYPNAEVLMQLLVFGGLLAFGRASADGDVFFAPVAAVLLTLSFLAHLTGFLVIGAVAVAALVSTYDRRAPQFWFLLPLGLGTAIAARYYATLMAPYIEIQMQFVLDRVPLAAPVAALLTLGMLLALSRSRVAPRIPGFIPIFLWRFWASCSCSYATPTSYGSPADRSPSMMPTLYARSPASISRRSVWWQQRLD